MTPRSWRRAMSRCAGPSFFPCGPAAQLVMTELRNSTEVVLCNTAARKRTQYIERWLSGPSTGVHVSASPPQRPSARCHAAVHGAPQAKWGCELITLFIDEVRVRPRPEPKHVWVRETRTRVPGLGGESACAWAHSSRVPSALASLATRAFGCLARVCLPCRLGVHDMFALLGLRNLL